MNYENVPVMVLDQLPIKLCILITRACGFQSKHTLVRWNPGFRGPTHNFLLELNPNACHLTHRFK